MVKTIKLKRAKTERRHILRWEDDGGKTIETNHVTLDPPFVQTMPIYGALPAKSLPWKQQFVIEPFHPDPRICLVGRNAPIKK